MKYHLYFYPTNLMAAEEFRRVLNSRPNARYFPERLMYSIPEEKEWHLYRGGSMYEANFLAGLKFASAHIHPLVDPDVRAHLQIFTLP